MIRAILRNVQIGLIISASLLVVLAFQRLSLYSVPVLVGNIVHPGQPPSGDSKELVGHGHAHGQHRIFSTNVIEIGLFKFVVPFRWSSAGEEDVEEEAVKGESVIEKRRNKMSRKTGQSGNTIRRSRNERVGGNTSSEPVQTPGDVLVEGEKTQMLGASLPRLQQKRKQSIPPQDRTDSSTRNDNENESKLQLGQERNKSEVDDSLLLLHLNETLIQSNVTALPGRRLLKEEKISTAWWLSSWLTRKAAEQGR